ncbi:MAG: DNA-directed DNA polymerase I [Candidatus Heimdallarchaeota archaeon]
MDIPLDAFLFKPSKQGKKEKKTPQKSTSKGTASSKARPKLKKSPTSISKEKEQFHLIGVQYDGKLQKALMQFYNDRTASIVEISDPYNHHSYCLSDLPPERIMEFKAIKTNERVLKPIQTIERFDLISERKRTFSKIEASDPLTIGGTRNSVREILPRAWEAKIRYHLNYIYDFQLIPSMPYRLTNGEIVRPTLETDRETQEKINAVLQGEIEKQKELSAILNEYLPLFVTPVPNIKRAAIDVEITSPSADTLPDPKQAEQSIISVALVGSDSKRYVFLLRRKGTSEGTRSETLLKGVHCVFFEEEKEDALLRLLFAKMHEYPILLTFNGDRFDFLYLYNRAKRLGFQEKDIPLSLGRDQVYVDKGIHIDLYRFFFNASIRIYAFSTKYKDVSLDAVSYALLGKGKIDLDSLPHELSLYDLAAYNLRDAELTLNLTTFDNNLAWNLIILLSRIVKLPLEDLIRTGVSKWIENLFYFEHRKRNYLIPLPEEVRREGEAVTKAIIKGKKYKGALVVPPKAGIHFKTVVLDFSSLYPSIIKVTNLSYETINCSHVECKTNIIPDTPHWVCTKKSGLTSLLVGFLRDIRVLWFKQEAKNPNLPPARRNLFQVVEKALKVLLNASYGAFGAAHFALYCPAVAESTTAVGRDAIMQTIDKAQDIGVEILYGDTDSVFLKDPNPEQIEQLIQWSIDELKIPLDVDKVYRYVALSDRKKNYLGVFEDGSVDIKGLIAKKRNTPQFVKEAFARVTQILGNVQTEAEFRDAKEQIREVVKESYQKLEKSELSLEELAFRVQLNKPISSYHKTTPQHVKAAIMLAERRLKRLRSQDAPLPAATEKASRDLIVPPGTIISYVKTSGGEGVLPVEGSRRDEISIDVPRYKDYVETTFTQILDAMGIPFSEMQRIVSLDSFF